MAVDALISGKSPNQKVAIDKSMGMLVFKFDNEKPICLVLHSDFTILEICQYYTGKQVSEVKFIGGEHILKKIRSVAADLPEIAKTLIVKDRLEIFFFSQNGQIKILKQDLPRKKKVLVVDDSQTIQKLLSKIINSSEKLEVMGVASGAEEAKEMIEKEEPDLVTLDIHMPGMNGVEFMKTFLRFKNISTVMISSVSMGEGPLVVEALSNGALSYIQKPSVQNLDEIAPKILDELEILAQRGPCRLSSYKKKANQNFATQDGVIAIGSSTGGTEALRVLLAGLPDKIPPILIVQHIPAVFSKALADRLNDLCPFTVKEAVDGDPVLPNTVYIAPGGMQMKVRGNKERLNIRILDDPPVNRFKPSVDYMFNSIAQLGLPKVVATILTGMGRDGARGICELKNRGAYTLAQDEASSVVFGMPKEAIRMGGAKEVVSIEEMANSIILAHNKRSIKNAS